MKIVQLVLGLIGVALIVFFQLFGQTLLAADAVQRVEDECRMVLEKNFNGVNAEDVKMIASTFSKEAASGQYIADFTEEATKMFEETDVYMRLVDFKLIDLRPPYATAMVIQMTLPADEKDREPVRHQRLGVNYRHHSALLPEFEMVTYRQIFRYENGKWKVHASAGVPLPTDLKELPDSLPRPQAAVKVNANCPNGNCSWPRVKTAAMR